jgi:membrane associated rhomboid family serine protease
MMLFPMKARYFVMILGAVELVTLMDTGTSSQVANLAHLGGIVVGFLFLMFVARYRAAKSQAGKARGRRLKLVVDNERRAPASRDDDPKGPKYWN